MKKLVHFRPVFFGFIALLLGIIFAKEIFKGDFTYILLTLALLAFVIVFSCYYKKLSAIIILGVFFISGLGLYEVSNLSFFGNDYLGKEVVISGKVSDGFMEYTYSRNLTLTNVIIDGKREDNISVSVTDFSGYFNFEAGDILTFKTDKLQKVKLFDIGVFNSFYLRAGTPYEVKINTEAIQIDKAGLTFSETLRENVKNLLNANLDKDTAAIAYATLFGDKIFVAKEQYNIFKNSGILHLLAVSGLHIGFITAIISFLLKKFNVRRTPAFVITGLILLVYCFLCGFSPSVLRATLMSLIILAAALSGKQYDGLNAVGLTGIIILVAGPLYAFDAGFLMSFFSVLCIFTIYKPLRNLFVRFVPNKIAASFAMSISASVGVFPFMSSFSGTFNILSVFANLIIIPVFTIAFSLLFISVVLGLMMPFLGFLLVIPGLLIKLIFSVATWFSGAEMFILNLKPIDIIATLLIFVICFVISKFFMMNLRRKAMLVTVLACITFVYITCYNMPLSYDKTLFACLDSYGEGTYVITSTTNEVALIGLSKLNSINKYTSKSGIKNIDYAFCLDSVQSSKASELKNNNKVTAIISVKDLKDFDDENIVYTNYVYNLGSFTFKYIETGGKLIGIEVKVDGNNFFIANDVKADFIEVKNIDYDLCAINENDFLYNYFPNAKNIISKSVGEYSNSKYGNFDFMISEGTMSSVRRLD